MKTKYLPKEFEEKLIQNWGKEEVSRADKRKGKKIYVLSMFPYPSGSGLHVGHARIYIGTDVLARYFRMKGYAVLNPIGWDAFGLPAENAAIKAKKNPVDMVPQNIAVFKRQMQRLGLSYDWSREFSTTDPDYYKWTQWLFIQFFKLGLLEKKNSPINFCPFCKTGLSEEEVLPNGTHERCGTKIEKRELPQWIFKITKYADRLLSDLEGLDWPEGILQMQRNWIGRSEGTLIKFPIYNSQSSIEVFTTRPETIDGATFLVVAPEHKIVADSKMSRVKDYVEKAKAKSETERETEGREKTGLFTGLYVLNPVTKKKIPVWVADYVLGGYGTGAIMAVPAADERDKEFAEKFNLPMDETSFRALPQGEKKVNYHLRDWIFSRQRYWGEPIPMVYCEKCGWFPIDEKELPLELPYVKSYEPTDTGESPLVRVKDWVRAKCPNCGGEGRRETDTMPNWAGSCWYFLRFTDPKNKNESWSKKEIEKWLPVDWYIGGAEHAVLHLLYARFWVKALYDLKLLPFAEPFMRLRNVGMVLGEDHKKMSKSIGNVINPDDVIDEFGADALRMHEMFMAPFNQEIAWSTQNLQGPYRFIMKVWQIYSDTANITKNAKNEDKKLSAELQRLISKIEKDITNVKFNTAISSMMEFLNKWEKSSLSVEETKIFLKILAPFAPFVTDQIWKNVLKEKNSIHLSSWPEIKSAHDLDYEVSIPIQVNGKVRAILTVLSSDTDEKVILKKALEQPSVQKHLEGKNYKTIYVKGKVLNFIPF